MWEGTLETHPDPNTEPCWSLPPKLEIGMVVSCISVKPFTISLSVYWFSTADHFNCLHFTPTDWVGCIDAVVAISYKISISNTLHLTNCYCPSSHVAWKGFNVFWGVWAPPIPTLPALFLWEYSSFSGYNFIYLPLWCAHHQYPFQLTGICIIFCCACIIISHSDLTKPCPETPCPIVNISGGRIHAFRRSLSRLCLD